MTRARRADQPAILRDEAAQQAARVDETIEGRAPDLTDPDYCPQSRDGLHTWRRDRRHPNYPRRCLSCAATKDAEGRVTRLTGETFEARR